MQTEREPSLHRHLTLPLVTFYGLGTIIGAGIYVLVSEVASTSGTSIAWAFLTAGLIATLTGACYAELCSRFPHAAGAVLYVDQAFSRPFLSQLVGVLVLITGVVSAATISRGFVGYLNIYWAVSPTIAITGLCLLMGLITSIGIRESAWIITLITLLEVGGLLLVLYFTSSGADLIAQPDAFQITGIGPVLAGAFLAFYAFIGFEDLVNLAEEVREPRRNLPRAILISLVLSVLLYLAVALTALSFVSLEDLSASTSPLATMVSNYPKVVAAIGIIGMIAISNGALTQIIMASRMLYGMARRGLLPPIFGRIHPRTRTPFLNTWLVTGVILGFALWLPLATLARITSSVMLIVFIFVNLSLLKVQAGNLFEDHTPRFIVPRWIPVFALLANLFLLAYPLLRS